MLQINAILAESKTLQVWSHLKASNLAPDMTSDDVRAVLDKTRYDYVDPTTFPSDAMEGKHKILEREVAKDEVKVSKEDLGDKDSKKFEILERYALSRRIPFYIGRLRMTKTGKFYGPCESCTAGQCTARANYDPGTSNLFCTGQHGTTAGARKGGAFTATIRQVLQAYTPLNFEAMLLDWPKPAALQQMNPGTGTGGDHTEPDVPHTTDSAMISLHTHRCLSWCRSKIFCLRSG